MARLNLRDLLRNLFGVETTIYEDRYTGTVGTSAVQILKADPKRVSFIISNVSNTAVYISTNPAITIGEGIYIGANGGNFIVSWDIDFSMPSLPFYAIAANPGSSIHVVENVIS